MHRKCFRETNALSAGGAGQRQRSGGCISIHPAHARRLARRGQLPCYKIGGQFRFDLEEVKRWCRESLSDGRQPEKVSRNLPDEARALPHPSAVQGNAANETDLRRSARRQGNVRPNAARPSSRTPKREAKRERELGERIARAVRLVPLP